MYENAELEAFLEEESKQTQKEFALALGEIQHAFLQFTFTIIRNDSKARKFLARHKGFSVS